MAVKGLSIFTYQGEDYTINDPNVATEFDSATAYSAGEIVNYQGNLYIFTTDHAAGNWNSNHVVQTNINLVTTNIKENYSGPRLPTGTETKLSDLRLNGVYRLESSQIANMTDLPSDADNATTSTLINDTNAYSGGGFIIQGLQQPNKKEWRRLIVANTGAVYTPWYRVDNLAMYQSREIAAGVTALKNVVEPGVYNIPTAKAQNLTDLPSDFAVTTTTLLVMPNCFNGEYTTQFIMNSAYDVRYRTFVTATGVIFDNWARLAQLCTNEIAYAAIGDSRTYAAETVVTYPDVVKKIKGYKTVNNWGVGGSTYVKISDRTSAYEICAAHSFTSIDVVTMCFGYNDYARNLSIGTPGDTTDSTVCGAIYKCLDKIYTDNPKCAVFVFTPLPDKTGLNETFTSYVNAIVETCKHFNVPVFNCGEDGALPTLLYDAFFDYDNVHSTDYTIWGRWIASKIP